MNDYENLNFKIPIESSDYKECSKFIVSAVEKMIHDSMAAATNKIIINTNLRHGIPMENVNKIAGPFVEAWAIETFEDVLEDENNQYNLINVEAGERLNMADIILQFKRKRKFQSSVTGNIDVKATSKDIKNSGKSPNITSFARIRSAYIKDPDYIFIILSIKHRVFSKKDPDTKMMMGVMEVVDFSVYDIKFISSPDLSYNPALGTGQLQIRDIHYVDHEDRTIWEFCQMLDRKCIASKKGYNEWYRYAKQNKWLKEDD